MPRQKSIDGRTKEKIRLLKQKIHAIIEHKGMIQARIAEKVGMAETSLSRSLSLKGPHFASEQKVKEMAEVFGIPYSILMDDNYGCAEIIAYIDSHPSTLNEHESNGACGHDEHDDSRTNPYGNAAGDMVKGIKERMRIPPYLAHLIHKVGIDESIRRMTVNGNLDTDEGVVKRPIPYHVGIMVDSIGPLKAMERILVNPDTGEVSL